MFFNAVGSRVNNDSRAYSAIGAIGGTLSVPIEITGPTVDLEIDAFLAVTVFQVLPGDTITGALNNTASLRLTLSPGVELTGSKSGTFGEVITPIPVPAALPLFAAAGGATPPPGAARQPGVTAPSNPGLLPAVAMRRVAAGH